MKKHQALCLIGVLVLFVLLTQPGCRSAQQGAMSDESSLSQGNAAGTLPSSDVPVITVENPEHDFGEVGAGSRHQCEFKFKNTGSAVLKIERVQSTCGCTVPALVQKEYAPGEEGVVGVSFRSPLTKQQIDKHLYIISNDPQNPRVQVTIKAQIAMKVELSPESVELRLNEANAGMPELVLKSVDGREFSIKSIKVTPSNVMQIPFNASEKATSFTLTPVVDIDKLTHNNAGVVQINTDHPQSGALLLRYRALPTYEVSPPHIIMQNVVTGVPIVKDVSIRSNYGKEVEIKSAVSKNGYIEIESQEKDGNHLQLTVKITPPERNTSKKFITDELTVTLTDGTKLSIRCSGWFKS